MQQPLSINKYRQKKYLEIIQQSNQNLVTLQDIIHLGHRLMRKAKLHHHFFKNSLLKTSENLALHALKLPHANNNMNLNLSENNIRDVINLYEKRIAERMPVEYITNQALYLDYQFYVNEHVLVPRSVMSYRFREFLNTVSWNNNQILDLCTGSGCIGISLAMMKSDVSVDLVDISDKALAVAKHNVTSYALNERINCLHSDLFSQVNKTYDLIISNPPYVSTSELKASAAEFKNEPNIALESGKDGLDVVNRILREAKHYLNPNGLLIMEVGYAASQRIKRKYRHVPFTWFTYKNPLKKDTWFNRWFDKWFGLDCVLMCNYNALKGIK